MPQDEDRIRERAYRIWEDEGRPEGRHDDHWHRAVDETGDSDRTADEDGSAANDDGGIAGGLIPGERGPEGESTASSAGSIMPGIGAIATPR